MQKEQYKDNSKIPVREHTSKYGSTIQQQKSLKIPKGWSEAVNQRRTDKTMAKIKRTKGQTMIYKTLDRKLTIE